MPRRPSAVSGRGRGPAGLGARPAPEALSLSDPPRAACRGRGHARARVGRRSRSPGGSDRRILMIRIGTCRTRRSIAACLCRAAACSSRRSWLTSGSGGAIAGRRARCPSWRVYRRCRLDSGTTGHRRGPRRPRALGRRLSRGLAQFLYHDADGAALALRLSGPGHWERDADGRPDANAARPATPDRADGHADVGSRLGTRRPSHLLDRDGCAGVLLRPAESVAARHEREHQRGLLRQYFPRCTDLSGYSQRYLDAIARRLNTRPRKTLGYRTPADILVNTVALTG
jgi:hypothetical protein